MKEKEDGTVAYRLHGQKETTVLPLDEFVEKLTTEIETKARQDSAEKNLNVTRLKAFLAVIA